MFAGAYDAGVVDRRHLATWSRSSRTPRPTGASLRTTEYGDPEKDREALVKLSPVTYVDRVKAPLLLIQGASDPRVPVGEAMQIHDALAARDVPAELLIFADEGHGAQKRENVVQTLGRQLEFFEKWLKPAPPAAPPPSPTPR